MQNVCQYTHFKPLDMLFDIMEVNLNPWAKTIKVHSPKPTLIGVTWRKIVNFSLTQHSHLKIEKTQAAIKTKGKALRRLSHCV